MYSSYKIIQMKKFFALLFYLIIVSSCSYSRTSILNNSVVSSEQIKVSDEQIIFPELGKPQKLENDILFYEVLLKRQTGISKL